MGLLKGVRGATENSGRGEFTAWDDGEVVYWLWLSAPTDACIACIVGAITQLRREERALERPLLETGAGTPPCMHVVILVQVLTNRFCYMHACCSGDDQLEPVNNFAKYSCGGQWDSTRCP